MRALEATERWALEVWKRGAHDWILQSAPGNHDADAPSVQAGAVVEVISAVTLVTAYKGPRLRGEGSAIDDPGGHAASIHSLSARPIPQWHWE